MQRALGVLVLVFGMGGIVACGGRDGGGHERSPVGSWECRYDWGCTGGSAGSILLVYENGTCTASLGGDGTWVYMDDSLKLTFPGYGGTVIFIGAFVDDNTLSGTMTGDDGLAGCWSATRLGMIERARLKVDRGDGDPS